MRKGARVGQSASHPSASLGQPVSQPATYLEGAHAQAGEGHVRPHFHAAAEDHAHGLKGGHFLPHHVLRQAVVGKMFTPEQGKNIANSASLQKRRL